ncbi:MAG TPA: hypothetical protein VF614_03790 [Chthoniobacteraceae bacterium]|jgi:hypothetical protein
MAAPHSFRGILATLHGSFYVITGVWPLVHISSFLAVTGPKTDLWLVRTVGLLVTVIGVALLLAGRRRAVTPEIEVLAIGSALALMMIDIIYVSAGVIPPIYLADAAAELALILCWSVALLKPAART